MANPFTNSLSRRLDDDAFKEFIAYWDRLELLTIHLFKTGVDDAGDGDEFDKVFTWLKNNYGHFRQRLRPFWQQTSVGGQLIEDDPFRTILNVNNVADIPGNRSMIRLLPAAREALNRHLLDELDRMN